MGLLFEMVKKTECHRDPEWTYAHENAKSINTQEPSILFILQTEELPKPEDEIITIRGN